MRGSVDYGCLVSYKDEYYLFYGLTKNGNCKLLRADLSKYSGTPGLNKLVIVRELPLAEYNGHTYALTKQGIISCSTGNVMESYDIWLSFVHSDDILYDDIIENTTHKLVDRWNTFTYNGYCSSEMAGVIQAKLNYAPQGYGFYDYKYVNGITTWKCSHSCD